MQQSSKITAPTVNPQEITQYKGLSAIWWDKESSLDVLHILNDIRIPWIVEKLAEEKVIDERSLNSSKPLEGLTVLDVGCGGGFVTEALFKLGCTVVGIDPCLELIETAKSHQMEDPLLADVTYIHGTVEEHCKNNPEKYDVVVASEVVDHVNEQDLFLEVCAKCLKPGGSMFITTFNKTWISWLYNIFFFEYITGTIARGCHHLEQFISPEDVEKILEKHNCQTKSVWGFFYNVFSGKWSWTRFKSLSYALHAVKNKE